jgi:hypothetical protein
VGPLDALRVADLAAVAKHLGRLFHLPVPEWSETHGHGLTGSLLESLNAVAAAARARAGR